MLLLITQKTISKGSTKVIMNISCTIEAKVKGVFIGDKTLCTGICSEKDRDKFHSNC